MLETRSVIGKTISQYRIVEWLGEGAMGVVYLGEHTSLGRRVAIKFLSQTTKDYRARFLDEARAVAALNHPNIATVFDYGETATGQPYIVMELIEGQTLSDKLSHGSLPLQEAVRIVSQMAEGLGEAHRQGIVHRDVKPSNVVVTDRGQAKVLDFGLVKQIFGQSGTGLDSNRKTLPSTRTRSDVIVGTPLYLSPEQATGKGVDGRSDLFALGAVLYECITGQSAFSGGSVIEIGAQVLHVTPTLPSELNDRIPPELDRITMKAIEKKADDRYQTADELIADLRRVLPTLDDDNYSRGRSTESIRKTQTGTASALSTLIEQVKRPGPNRGIVLLFILSAAVLTGLAFWWFRPGPYKPAPLAKTWYDKGVEALRNGAPLQASRAFEQAIAADPDFALAHARLAEAWYEMDYSDKAKDALLKIVSNRSQLETSDRLRVDAINFTVGREHSSAIKAYQELVSLAPNEAPPYVDLGRAYEKNEDLNLAIESHKQAQERDPQYATAFLRAGILYARQLDQAHAASSFDRADTIFQALGSFEGQAEVSFQRGFLFNQTGKLDEARQHLTRALELAKTTNNEYLQVKTLQKLGDVEMEANNYAKARELQLEALAFAREKGIDNLVRRGLVDIGNTYLVETNFAEAEKYYRQSLAMCVQQKDARNTARARLALASVADRQAHTDEIIQLLEQVLPFYQQGGYRKELLQALALYGRAKVQKGDNEAASEAFEKELKQAEQLGDPGQTALAIQDLGQVAARQGNYPQALIRAEQHYQIARSLGAPKFIGLALVDRANVLARMGRYDEAEAALKEASTVAEAENAARNLSASYRLARARIALTEQRFDDAINQSQQALVLVSGTLLKRTTTGATLTGALAQVLSGDAAGRSKCEPALAVAREVGDPTVLSESLLAVAQVHLQGNDAASALKSALEAQPIFERAGNKDGEWVAWLVAARASRTLGDGQKMHEYAERAQKALDSIQPQWGNDNYSSYLARPDIKLLHTMLTQLLASETKPH